MKRLRILTLVVLALGLQGCEQAAKSFASSLATTDALGIFTSEDVNLTQKSYAAADYLVQQSRSYISRHDVIKPVTLTDQEEPRIHSMLGRRIPEQVGLRFSQLGYNVDLDEVTTGENNYLKPGQKRSPAFVLSGSYLRRPQELDVSLRMTELSSGRVIAVFDYTMPMNREIADLAKPETRIIKVTP